MADTTLESSQESLDFIDKIMDDICEMLITYDLAVDGIGKTAERRMEEIDGTFDDELNDRVPSYARTTVLSQLRAESNRPKCSNRRIRSQKMNQDLICVKM